ncbi:hypothetical protein GQ600_16 [Phytophthora cactorum]|nr:hypothetical protein GQ600_16 [Phytophthora cactorum]
MTINCSSNSKSDINSHVSLCTAATSIAEKHCASSHSTCPLTSKQHTAPYKIITGWLVASAICTSTIVDIVKPASSADICETVTSCRCRASTMRFSFSSFTTRRSRSRSARRHSYSRCMESSRHCFSCSRCSRSSSRHCLAFLTSYEPKTASTTAPTAAMSLSDAIMVTTLPRHYDVIVLVETQISFDQW